MLLNAYRDLPSIVPGTRLLSSTLGVGARIQEPGYSKRIWEVQGLYLPLQGRALGGIRAKCTDQKDFVTFCNQRDLEVLLGLHRPGTYCEWSGEEYLDPSDREWCGFCADEEDLMDDLYERELLARIETPGGILPAGLGFTRRVHVSTGVDVEDDFFLIQDVDFETGFSPDVRFETVERRWARAERRRVRWDRL